MPFITVEIPDDMSNQLEGSKKNSFRGRLHRVMEALR